ncbi:hypothetical protein EDB81DRAFT_689275 [Dactylonectria macrodidyma]|uniref:Uncharacterized protein n=1 Tax=Dactylonectria macrodidyma TaxID=307937 RepID=A0A9P9EVR1_9HYPO|nr:hypothetical protein EDB81DRAFT_689275 [Dactylonectria macrodidyma]
MAQSQGPDQPVLSYDTGVIHAHGAFTTEIHIEARVSLQDVWNDQYHGSQIVGKRPGMYLKYLPCRYHDVSGDVLTGGAYLFRTLEEANDYKRWTSNDLQVGEPKTTFWKQPLFKSVNLWAWNVIGAHNFAPVDSHAVGRFQRWKYDIKDAKSILQQHYPVLKDAAEKRGATSVWLLHSPEEKMIAIQTSFRKSKSDDYDAIQDRVVSVAQETSIGEIFSDALKAEPVLDRTSPFLAVWLPLSKSDDAVEVKSPVFPALSKASGKN